MATLCQYWLVEEENFQMGLDIPKPATFWCLIKTCHVRSSSEHVISNLCVYKDHVLRCDWAWTGQKCPNT